MEDSSRLRSKREHEVFDCNGTCNVEHIFYNQTYFVSSVALRQRHGTSVGSFSSFTAESDTVGIPISSSKANN